MNEKLRKFRDFMLSVDEGMDDKIGKHFEKHLFPLVVTKDEFDKIIEAIEKKINDFMKH